MHAIDARGEDDLGGNDAHGLAFEVGGNGADDGGVVKKSLLCDADVCRETCLGLFLGSQRGKIAGGGFGQPRDAARKVEELRGGQGADEVGQVGGEDVHPGLNVVCQGSFGAVEGEGHFAGGEDALEFGRSHWLASGGGGFDRDHHKGGAVKNFTQWSADQFIRSLSDALDAIFV